MQESKLAIQNVEIFTDLWIASDNTYSVTYFKKLMSHILLVTMTVQQQILLQTMLLLNNLAHAQLITCSDKKECSNSTSTLVGLEITCDGYGACSNSNLTSSPGNIECSAGYSCSLSDSLITPDGYIGCFSDSSCKKSIITTADGQCF